MSRTVLSFVFICCLAYSCGRTRNDVLVYTSNVVGGLSLHLHLSQFKIIYKQENASDTATGSVRSSGDTLMLTYNTGVNSDRQDTARIGGFVPVGEVFSPVRGLKRPRKLLVGARDLLYLDPATNQPVKTGKGDEFARFILKEF